jgi:hypothetical protein
VVTAVPVVQDPVARVARVDARGTVGSIWTTPATVTPSSVVAFLVAIGLRGDLVLEELPEAAVLRIDPAQQFAFVKAEADRVVRLPRTRLPGRALAGHDSRQTIEICNNRPVNRLVKGKQSGLVGQELPDGGHFLAVLGNSGQ